MRYVQATSPVTHFLLTKSHDVTSPLIDRLPAVRLCDPALDWSSEPDRQTKDSKKKGERERDQPDQDRN